MSQPTQLQELLGLQWPPVALSFTETAPEGVARVPAGSPAGCGYWRRAAEGEVFYTEAADHYGCPVGAHTHGVELPPEKLEELQGLVQVMVGLEYLDMAEVAALPRRPEPFQIAVYAPLDRTPGEPDVVIVRGNPRQVMLLAEAANAAGVGPQAPPMGRPACVVVPETLRGARGAASLGCVGNRVYTGLEDQELYFAIPGAALEAVTRKLATIVHANRELEQFHRARC